MKYKEMEQIVFSYPRLQERIRERNLDKSIISKHLKEIAANPSMWIFGPFVKILDLVVKKFYHEINLEWEDDTNYDELVKNNNVVFVPNHQSHADYIVLNFIVYKIFKTVLYVAGGINLNIFLVGSLFRRCGCFFIRRSFANDILYRLTLEAYLYYLLLQERPIEFFFEGGRSRTGKLRSPRFGLYQMLVEANEAIPSDKRKPLKFVPVSIIHEYVPEQKSLARELEGSKKKKESFTQLFKLLNLFMKHFGSVHVQLGSPVKVRKFSEHKKTVQNLAFECFHTVGRNMLVSPSSLLAMIMLDEPIGAMKFEDILTRAQRTVKYCQKYSVSITESLKLENLEDTLKRTVSMYVNNKKIVLIGKDHFGHSFYSIKREARTELLYIKNTIIHHFFVPWVVNLGWINLFNGSIETKEDIHDFFSKHRSQFIHEFYLASPKEFIKFTLNLLSDAAKRPVKSLGDCVHFTKKEIYGIASELGVFSRCCSYIYEGHYLVAMTIRSLISEEHKIFALDAFKRELKENFKVEHNFGKVVRYSESVSAPLVKNALKYFEDVKIIKNDLGAYEVIDIQKLDKITASYAKDLTDQLAFNLRVYG